MTSNIFAHSDQLSDIRKRVRQFIDTEAIPQETAQLAHDVQGLDQMTKELRKKAIAAGIYAPQLPVSLGGLGLSLKDCCVILEEAGRSFLGPLGYTDSLWFRTTT